MPEHKKNAFIAIGESYSDKRISKPKDFTNSPFVGGSMTGVLQYPLGLGGDLGTPPNWTHSTATSVIPFTLFMPYKRNIGLDALYSTMQGESLFTQLPPPEFAIALPTPSSALKTDTTVEYNQFDINGAVGAILSARENNKEKLNVFKELTKENIDKKQKEIQDNIKEFNKQIGLGAVAEIGRQLLGESVTTAFGGVAVNPYTEYAFKNVQPRLHTFSYVFMPRSKQESEVIDRIINVFKYSMLPRPSAKIAAYFEFPYEFQIVHSMQHTTFALLPSVLKVCEIDYSGGTDSPKFFAKTDYPAKITMNMQFQEVVLLNRNYVTKDEELFKADSGVGPAANSTFRFRF